MKLTGGKYRVLAQSKSNRVLLVTHDGKQEVLKQALRRKARRRLRTEYKILCQMGYHPNIIEQRGLEEIDDHLTLRLPYFCHQNIFIEARNSGWPNQVKALKIAVHTARALQHAHTLGFLHLDVKMHNVYRYRGRYVLGDWGCALPVGGDRKHVITDIKYAPSEIYRNINTPAANIYSLGCTLYKLLTGTAPFACEPYRSTIERAMAHVQTPVPAIRERRAEIPGPLADIVDRSLAKAPGDRYAAPDEVAEALEPLASGSNLAALLEQAAGNETPVESPPLPASAAAPLGKRKPARFLRRRMDSSLT